MTRRVWTAVAAATAFNSGGRGLRTEAAASAVRKRQLRLPQSKNDEAFA